LQTQKATAPSCRLVEILKPFYSHKERKAKQTFDLLLKGKKQPVGGSIGEKPAHQQIFLEKC
jgi:hypothetical protein